MFRVRFDWGVQGLQAVAADAAVVIVDVLCFTTCVSVACDRGAAVYPCEWNDERAAGLAARTNAVLAAKRGEEARQSGKFTLSPPSLLGAYPKAPDAVGGLRVGAAAALAQSTGCSVRRTLNGTSPCRVPSWLSTTTR
jgi:hypothetical protein